MNTEELKKKKIMMYKQNSFSFSSFQQITSNLKKKKKLIRPEIADLLWHVDHPGDYCLPQIELSGTMLHCDYPKKNKKQIGIQHQINISCTHPYKAQICQWKDLYI